MSENSEQYKMGVLLLEHDFNKIHIDKVPIGTLVITRANTAASAESIKGLITEVDEEADIKEVLAAYGRIISKIDAQIKARGGAEALPCRLQEYGGSLNE